MFGSVTLLVHYHTVYAKRVLADRAVQVPRPAFSGTELPPVLKFILWSRREMSLEVRSVLGFTAISRF